MDAIGYSVDARLRELEERQSVSEARVSTIIEDIGEESFAIRDFARNEAISATSSVSSELECLHAEIQSIKDAIIDVQDMLRNMGLDDISRRLGDLNLLLT